MAEQQRADERTDAQAGSGTTIKRRGILAAAGAVVAGIMAKQAEPVVAAQTFLLPDTETAGLSYSVVGPTSITSTSTYNTHQSVLLVNGKIGADGAAIQGTQTTPTPAPAACGVYGQGGFYTGVFGDGSTGVQGVATTDIGVYGKATTGDGVYGSSTGGNGVYGIANAAGSSSIVAGVYGTSSTTYGIIGNTTAAGYSGLTGTTSTPGVAALAATALVPTAYAAYFSGKTVVEGDFYVVKHADGTGGGKFAAVPGRDGGFVGMYATESPEPWFEDFGTGKITGGTAAVSLDPAFAALIHTDDYHVFLTAHSDQHLHVPQRMPTGFRVAMTTTGAVVKGTANAVGGQTFSWRVVGKRKDIAGTRLPKVELPKINHPDPDKLPKPPMPHVPGKKP
ncbi:MAG: hypothetical protein ACYDAR_06805 [Thermomicrobiales bacterium]